MCVVTIRIDSQSNYPFIFIGNRDELYQRPSQEIHQWADLPHLYGGKDLEEGGTWLGITDKGHFSTLLNHPYKPEGMIDPPKTRGHLVRDYLGQPRQPEEVIEKLRTNRKNHRGYHFIFGNLQEITLYSNVEDRFMTLNNGLYTFSNTEDDMSNFRISQGQTKLSTYLSQTDQPQTQDLINLFHDCQIHPNFKTHPAQFDFDRARNASSLFIEDDYFGTVGTTAILVNQDGGVIMAEQTYSQAGIKKDYQELSFSIK